MAEDGLGNVVLSRPFQMAEIELVTSTVIDRELIWTHAIPKQLSPIKRHWIYAFEVGERNIDQKPILAAEYRADDQGALSFVPGLKRRLVDATDESGPKPTPIREATLPVARQRKALRYIFVATRGRMGKDAIWQMENGLRPLFIAQDLVDGDTFKHAPGAPSGPFFVLVVDPLTLAENLNRAYQEALNDAINFSVVHEFNPKKADIAIQSRKYQLAKMIRDTLLEPEGDTSDPLGLRGYMAGGGQVMLNFIRDHESIARRMAWRSRNAARELVRLLDSGVWGDAYRWYLGTEAASNRVGHYFLEATDRSIERLSETPEGKELIRELVEDRKHGFLSYLYPPEEDADAEAKEHWEKRFPIARKVATATVLALCETAPALVVFGKIKDAQKLIQRTVKVFLKHTEVSMLRRAPDGHVARALKLSAESVHIQVDCKQAKVDLEKWIEEGKPHWPEDHKLARASELLSRLFMVVEAINLYNEVQALRKGDGARLKVVGAVLDMAAAAEDPIRALANRLRSSRAGGKAGVEGAEAAGGEALAAEASAGMRQATVEASEKEAKGLLGKIVAPAAFKFLGAVSAVIDFYFNSKEALETSERDDIGESISKRMLAAGSGVLFVGYICSAAGYLLKSALLTAASASILTVGLVIVVAGLVVAAMLSTSAWQKFVRHSCFGDRPAHPGNEKWSDGDFAEWLETPAGLDRQIKVLTTMLCAFKISGIGFDAQTMTITFGAIPLQAKLMLEFSITYENGFIYRPSYIVDLDSSRLRADPVLSPVARFEPYHQGNRLRSLLVTADRPESVGHSLVKKASCSVVIRYGHGDSASPASGTIPIGGPLRYEIFDGSGMGNFEERRSLDD